VAEVEADLPHRDLYFGMYALTWFRSCRDGFRLERVCKLIKERRCLLGTPGIVNTSEDDFKHGTSPYEEQPGAQHGASVPLIASALELVANILTLAAAAFTSNCSKDLKAQREARASLLQESSKNLLSSPESKSRLLLHLGICIEVCTAVHNFYMLESGSEQPGTVVVNSDSTRDASYISRHAP